MPGNTWLRLLSQEPPENLSRPMTTVTGPTLWHGACGDWLPDVPGLTISSLWGSSASALTHSPQASSCLHLRHIQLFVASTPHKLEA